MNDETTPVPPVADETLAESQGAPETASPAGDVAELEAGKAKRQQ